MKNKATEEFLVKTKKKVFKFDFFFAGPTSVQSPRESSLQSSEPLHSQVQCGEVTEKEVQ